VPEAPQGARSDPIPHLATTSAIGHSYKYRPIAYSGIPEADWLL
jgi:hypothetical protein